MDPCLDQLHSVRRIEPTTRVPLTAQTFGHRTCFWCLGQRLRATSNLSLFAPTQLADCAPSSGSRMCSYRQNGQPSGHRGCSCHIALLAICTPTPVSQWCSSQWPAAHTIGQPPGRRRCSCHLAQPANCPPSPGSHQC